MENLILGESELGASVFANKDFKKGEEIIEFKGKVMRKRELSSLINLEDNRYLQIGKDRYLGPSGNYDDFFNHSCNPNSGIKINSERILLIAIKDIKRGEEIRWDYSTTIDEDDWKMICKCGSKNCRRKIRDFKYLQKNIQQNYINLGIVPEYILKKL